ncbi:MAG: LysM peptidoglycan-binding domain-containing protein [Anaerolineae bacterium]|nr:LysM peptidoglycan-binding domain-containing protein [Anaerolineae bacterium]
MRRILTLGLILALMLTAVAPALAESSIVHVVRPGDNLFRIGLRYGVTVDALVAANGLRNANYIWVGQKLIVPSGNYPDPDAPSSRVHTVRRGENLYRIALRYGISYQALASANDIVNPNHIYVGQHLRIPRGGSSPSPQPPSPSPSGTRWIDINLSAQRLTAYVGGTAVRSTYVSTGLPRTPTPTGDYRVYVKYVSRSMSGPGYYLPNVPYVMFFYRGYSIHGTYWHSNFGQPMSHGCVNLPTSEAQWIFSWASVGTLVRIHY